MTSANSAIIHSELSQTLTLDGVTVQVLIFRGEHQRKWALEVIGEGGIATLWDDQFDSEVDALAAFHMAVQEEGMSVFLEVGDTPTIH